MINHSAEDGSISLNFLTELVHKTCDLPQKFKVTESKVNIMA